MQALPAIGTLHLREVCISSRNGRYQGASPLASIRELMWYTSTPAARNGFGFILLVGLVNVQSMYMHRRFLGEGTYYVVSSFFQITVSRKLYD